MILNAYGETNNIKVSQEEVNSEIQKQFKMMPGQEKMVKEYYEQNPSAIDGIRGSIYEEKIINQIKKDAKVVKKEISKEEAEKILKEAHKHDHGEEKKETKKKSSTTSAKERKPTTKKAKSKPAAKKTKKVSKK